MSSKLKDILWIPINVFQLLWLFAFIAVLFPPVMLTFLFTGNPETAWSTGRAFWGPLNLFFGFSSLVIEDAENLPKAGEPCVVMMNHQSMIDILVAWLLLPTGPRFVAKAELLYVPLVGLFMKAMGLITIDRKNRHAAIKALRKAHDIVQEGHILTCFPEGTRTRDGFIGPFKKGVFVVAQRTAAPIVPIAIDNCAKLVPRTGWRPRPAILRAKIGKPIDATGLTRDELMKRVRNEMIDLHLALGGMGGDKSNAIAVDEETRSRRQAAVAA
ncbi:MAG: lysophospholipid acyltransferase family protein [Deltaproteobacteria bacterium]|nr:lysophospholipid acyltransferase family protein [Deltaproteobacteria bacterium]